MILISTLSQNIIIFSGTLHGKIKCSTDKIYCVVLKPKKNQPHFNVGA